MARLRPQGFVGSARCRAACPAGADAAPPPNAAAPPQTVPAARRSARRSRPRPAPMSPILSPRCSASPGGARAQSEQRAIDRQGQQLPVEHADADAAISSRSGPTAAEQGRVLSSRSRAKCASNTIRPSPIEIVADGQSWSCATAISATQESIRCRRRRCASCSPTAST